MGRLELIECVENNDSDGILRCLEAGHPIDESEAVQSNYMHNSKDGKTALLVACTLGNMDIVKLLIEKNATVFEKDCVFLVFCVDLQNDMNAVLFAASNNFVDLVEYLIELGVDPNETDKVLLVILFLYSSRVEMPFTLLANMVVMRLCNIFCTRS